MIPPERRRPRPRGPDPAEPFAPYLVTDSYGMYAVAPVEYDADELEVIIRFAENHGRTPIDPIEFDHDPMIGAKRLFIPFRKVFYDLRTLT